MWYRVGWGYIGEPVLDHKDSVLLSNFNDILRIYVEKAAPETGFEFEVLPCLSISTNGDLAFIPVNI